LLTKPMQSTCKMKHKNQDKKSISSRSLSSSVRPPGLKGYD
jgi:hypothetical protein